MTGRRTAAAVDGRAQGTRGEHPRDFRRSSGPFTGPHHRPGATVSGWTVGLLVAGLALSLSAASSVGAQVVRERQVPLDTAGTVLEIDPELRRALGLFGEVAGFRSARLFRLSEGGHVLEITLRDAGGDVVRERRPLSSSEVADLRSRVSGALGGRSPAVLSTDGRAGLVLTATALGLGYYAWVVPAAFDLEDRSAVAAYLLTAAAGFLVPYRLTEGRPVRRTQRNAAAWGATRGIVYGLGLGDALTGGEELDEGEGDGDEDVTLALGMASSILGGVLGYRYGGRDGVDEGLVAVRAAVGDFSLAWGFGTSVALGLYEGDRECFGDVCTEDEFRRRPAGNLASLALGAAGTWAAGRWPSARRHTLGDARALRSFGLLGAQVVVPLAWAAFEDVDGGERAFAASLVAGSVAGMWTGDRILRERELSSGAGLLVLAGHAAGGLGALGLTYLVDDTPDDREVLYMATSALGSLAGSWLTLRAVGDEVLSESEDGPRVDVGPLPLALASLLGPRPGRRTDVPWLTLRF